MTDINRFKEMLEYIDPSSLNYQEWVNVGMALKAEGCPLEWWDDWSSKDAPRYHFGECYAKWNTFESSGVTGGTLQYMAESNGYVSDSEYHNVRIIGDRYNPDGTFNWNAKVTFEEEPIIDKSWISREDFREPSSWDPAEEVITYLSTLFKRDEYVGYVMTSKEVGEDEKKKWIPSNAGVYTQKAGDLIDLLRETRDISKAMGDYNPKSGAWIRFNPLDGNGVTDKNVTDYRYALVECDNMDLGMQVSMLKELQIPIAVLMYSGGKSIHAIVKINARNKNEYKKRVDHLYEICKKNGFVIDTQNKNESRLSRLPGVMRNGHKQFIIDTDIGMPSWDQWSEYIESLADDLPDPVVISEYWDNRPEQDPEVIQDILRKGRKMLIGGQSKVGKTNLVMQLALAIANGWTWIGKRCIKGKILYLNYELPEATFNERLELMCRRKGYDVREVTQNFHVLHLRNYFFQDVDRHVNSITLKFKREHYDALFIDPLYKLGDGEDENSAGAMGKLCNRFGRIASGMGCAVIVVHHFAKGDSSKKESMDRFSGSGVFARDADALLTLNKLNVEKDGKIACRIESTLREYPNMENINLWFDFPVHELDESGKLINAKLAGDDGRKTADENLLEWVDKLHFGFNMLTQSKEAKEVSQPELIRWMNASGDPDFAYSQSQRIAFLNRFKEATKKGYTYLAKRKSPKKNVQGGPDSASVIYIDPELYEEFLS